MSVRLEAPAGTLRWPAGEGRELAGPAGPLRGSSLSNRPRLLGAADRAGASVRMRGGRGLCMPSSLPLLRAGQCLLSDCIACRLAPAAGHRS